MPDVLGVPFWQVLMVIIPITLFNIFVFNSEEAQIILSIVIGIPFLLIVKVFGFWVPFIIGLIVISLITILILIGKASIRLEHRGRWDWTALNESNGSNDSTSRQGAIPIPNNPNT